MSNSTVVLARATSGFHGPLMGKKAIRLASSVACLFFAIVLVAPGVAALDAGAAHAPSATSWVVAFDDAAAIPGRGAAFLGGHVLLSRPEAGYALVSSTRSDIAALAGAQPHVRYAEPDVEVHALGFTPNDPQWSNIYQYAPRQIGATDVWNRTLGDSTVVICFVDSGMRISHEDLRERYVGGMDFVTGLAQPLDDMGHGTAVAGVAAATTNNAIGMSGVARVGIRVAKVMSSTGASSGSALTDGIRYCADTGSDVISISLGTTGFSQLLSDTIDYAWSKGAVLVASAGNSGPCTDCIEYPARFDHVLAVGCFVSWNDKCPASSSGPQLDLMASGDKLLTTGYTADNEYVIRSGTSLAAPVVAGVAALMRSLDRSLTNDQIDSMLRSTAQDYGPAGFDPDFGYGLVRADRAAQLVGSTPPPPAPSVPDLALTQVTPSTAQPAQGTTVYANASISNAGTGSAGAFRAQLLVDGVPRANQSSAGLAAGATWRPSFAWAATLGSHTLTVKADPDQSVAESSESNNAASTSVSVSAPAAPPAPTHGVNLTPDSQSGKVKARQSVTYTMQVQNTGNVADRVYLSIGPAASGWSAALAQSYIDLAAGQSGSFTVTVSAGRLSRGASMTLAVTATSGADASLQDAGTLLTTVA